ncbi:MAG: PKD domain-containing protein, partial [Proteobacteria bacterium]|nr:PKD domain-containing protein [Pseudomonadota bacterium]
MAITKIAGELLESNLIRTTDLAFNTDLLVLDVDTGRIGIGQNPGNFKLDILGDTRITGNQTITGDLTVQGNTTTIDSQNLSIEDNMIVLNSSGSIGNDSGLMINRGAAGNNAVFFWDEDADKFKVGTTSDDGSTQTDFGSATLAKLQIGAPAADSDASTKKYVDDSITTVTSSGGVTGTNVTLGLPTDSSVSDGAVTLNISGSVTDAIDDLNEVQENIRSSYYVKSVTYTRTPAAGSLGMTVTLAITAVGGGATRYTVDWGDGTTETVSATNPTHAYNENSGTPYTITVKAYNHNAVTDSAGSFANSGDSMTNLQVTVYTATPVPAFEIYTASSGGSALTGNDLWVTEGQTRYLRNTTTNTSGATVAYTMSWGDDSSTDNIANDSASGGVSGSRLSHTWGGGTESGTGRDTLTLTLTTHSTCNPALLPITATASLKVYDSSVAAPNHLGSKTVAIHSEDLVGTSPKLCSGFQEQVSGSPTYSAGDTVNRIVSDGSSRLRTAPQSTIAYNADSGTLTAYVNGSANGAISLSGSDNSGTATSLILHSEHDYQLYNASGTVVAFASSIYPPSTYKGFKAAIDSVTDSNGLLNTGVNSFQLQHTLGNSNTLEFVLDPVTATPTISGVGTLSEGTAGTYRYISG